MDNSILKANARTNLQKNHWLCVAVALFMSWGAGSILPTFNFSFNSSSESYDFSDIESFIYSLEEFFSNPNIIPMITFGSLATLTTIIASTAIRTFVFNTFTVGGSRFFLKQRKNHPAEFSELFANFKDKTFLNIAKVTFIRDILITLFTILFIVPGIIKTYEYWAVNYILAVRPDIDHKDALRLSKDIMNGHKFDLFVLGLSFYGWILLSLFTCGLLNIFYVAPYMQATYAEFFSYVREDAIARSVISPFDIPDYEPYIPPVPTAPFYSTSYGMNMPPQGFNQPQGFTQPQSFTQPQPPVSTDSESTEETQHFTNSAENQEVNSIAAETPETPDDTPTTDE